MASIDVEESAAAATVAIMPRFSNTHVLRQCTIYTSKQLLSLLQ